MCICVWVSLCVIACVCVGVSLCVSLFGNVCVYVPLLGECVCACVCVSLCVFVSLCVCVSIYSLCKLNNKENQRNNITLKCLLLIYKIALVETLFHIVFFFIYRHIY